MDDKTLPLTSAMARALDETELTLQIQFALCIAQIGVLEETNHALRADLKHEREFALTNANDHLKVIADLQKQIADLKAYASFHFAENIRLKDTFWRLEADKGTAECIAQNYKDTCALLQAENDSLRRELKVYKPAPESCGFQSIGRYDSNDQPW